MEFRNPVEDALEGLLGDRDPKPLLKFELFTKNQLRFGIKGSFFQEYKGYRNVCKHEGGSAPGAGHRRHHRVFGYHPQCKPGLHEPDLCKL